MIGLRIVRNPLPYRKSKMVLSPALPKAYSPKLVEGKFLELRLDGGLKKFSLGTGNVEA
jgi:hypothetical protein